MNKIRHIELFGTAACDVLNDQNLVPYLERSNCPGCIMRFINYRGHKYGVFAEQIEKDIKNQLKRIEIENYQQDFENIISG